MLSYAICINDITKSTQNDPTLQKLITAINNNTKFKNDLIIFDSFEHQLCVTSNKLILKDIKILVPDSLIHRLLETVHEENSGKSRILDFLRERFWFVNMNKITSNYIKTSNVCQSINSQITKTPIIGSDMPNSTWM